MKVIESREVISFSLTVEVPLTQARAFSAAMTGNDDDIVLAAETAMRDRIEDEVHEDDDERLEVGFPNERYAGDFLHNHGREPRPR
jgi:hypothetical protein